MNMFANASEKIRSLFNTPYVEGVDPQRARRIFNWVRGLQMQVPDSDWALRLRTEVERKELKRIKALKREQNREFRQLQSIQRQNRARKNRR